MRSVLHIVVVFVCSIAFLSSCSSGKGGTTSAEGGAFKFDTVALLKYDVNKADKKIDEFMQNLHKKRNFNGNVLVAKNGKIIYQKAIGWANYLIRDSLKLNYQFELASVTKPLTGTAIMMLVEQGKLQLDQDVKKFFPNFPYDGITIRMLLTHRSGMMNYVYFVDDLYRKEKRNQKKGLTNAEVMDLIAEYKPAPFSKPDKRFHYNNSNYMVLAAIIEKVSGKSYADFMKENIFIPAGMRHTAVYSKAVYEKIPVRVVGHDRGQWRYSVAQNFLDGPVGDKGVYSTVGDMFLFDQALRAGMFLKKETQDSSYKAHNPLLRGHFSYGYGWRTFDAPNQKVAYHTGWWHGFRHIYLRDLKNDVTIILLGNLTNGSLLQLDDLFKITGMPVVRKNAYNGQGDSTDD